MISGQDNKEIVGEKITTKSSLDKNELSRFILASCTRKCLKNGKESTVNRALGGSTYPG